MTYLLVLFLHSWVRWAVVVLVLISLASALSGWLGRADWTPGDQRLRKLTVGVVDLQVLLGLTLYFVLSPLTPRSLHALRAAMPNPVLRFYGLEHGVAMLLAVAVIHVASVRSQKGATPTERHRRWAIGLLVALLIIGASIPWPFFAYGRPLLRML